MIQKGPSILRLADFVNGSPFKPDDLGAEGFPVIRIRQLVDRTADVESALPPARPVWINDGDVVFSWSATLAVKEWDRGKALLNQHLFRVDPAGGVDRIWLRYVIEVAIDRLRPLMHGSAMTHITLDMLRSVTIGLPDHRRQRAIADRLDAETARIDALITKRQRQIGLLAEESAALRNRLIWAGDPATTPLRHITDPARPIMYGIVLPGPDTPGGVPIIKGGDVKRPLSVERLARTTPEIESRYRRARLRKGDVLFAIRGGVGDSAIVPSDVAGANITQDVARIAPGPTVCTDWLAHAVQTSRFLADAEERITGATIRGLNIWELKRCCVPVVSMADQQVAVETLSELLGRRSELARLARRQIELLRERRQALITAAVTGQLSSATT
ncbi:hypothetical protein BH24ACT4_BH24ACT4_02830 [soil metagenome]